MRDFPRSVIKVPNARMIPAYVITCSVCGTTEKLSANNKAGAIPPERLNAAFRNKGWAIGKKASGDVCPECQAKKGSNVVSMKKEIVNTPSNPQPPLVVVEPPRELNKEDRRLIFAKIDEVYLDNSYSKGWDDKKVATDLGVPLAWVRTIREENFGAEGIGEEQAKIMEEARDVAKKLNIEVDLLVDRINQGEKVRTELLGRANALLGKLADIEKLIS